MGKAKQYIIEVREGSKWVNTLWTNTAYQMCGGSRPVSYREAQKYLKSARRFYADSKYRIAEAKP